MLARPRPVQRRLLLILLVLSAALAAAASPAAAQEPLPDEPATTLYRAAMELESSGAFDLADSLLDYILREYPDSPAATAIRARLAETGARRIDSSGRTELVVWSTLYGLFLGVAVPGMLGADQPEAYGAGLLVGGPLGFFASYNPTRDTSIGDGDAGAITWGGTWGAWQGFGWAQVLEPGGDDCPSVNPGQPSYCEEAPSTEALLGSMVAGSAIGTGLGLLVADRHPIAPGQATTASLGSLWGTWFALAGGILADVSGDALLSTTLIGGNAGLVGGTAFAGSRRISRSDARIASIAGVAGGLAGAGLVLLMQPESDKVAIGFPLAGSILGLVMGASRIDGADPATAPQEADGRGRMRWELGGPLLPALIEDGSGTPSPALHLTLLSGRF